MGKLERRTTVTGETLIFTHDPFNSNRLRAITSTFGESSEEPAQRRRQPQKRTPHVQSRAGRPIAKSGEIEQGKGLWASSKTQTNTTIPFRTALF
jgi:hypothetical protein